MNDELPEVDLEWNELASTFDDDMEIEFLDDDDLLEFVHETEF
jgi:hypothetical protein